MYKYILFLVLPIFLYSCKEENNSAGILTLLEGSWIDVQTESVHISIVEEEEVFYVVSKEGKFPIIIIKDKYLVRLEQEEFPLQFDKENKMLSFRGEKFVAEDLRLNNQFIGTWENLEEQIVIVIEEVNGDLVWNISNGIEPAEVHLATKIENGFTFTYNEEEVVFIKVNNCIEDSKGKMYCKSKTGII